MYNHSIPDPANCKAVRVATHVGDLWLPEDDLVLLPYLQHTGTWEPSEDRLLTSLMKPDTRFLDIGANVGYFSALAAKCCPSGTIDAVEPDPLNVTLLRMNMWLHAPHANIWPVALGNARSIVGLNKKSQNSGDIRVEPEQTSATQLVAMTRADELFKDRSFDIIKIDVQGFELDVLLGMRQTLNRCRQALVVAEFFPRSIVERELNPLDVLRTYREIGLDRVACVEGKLQRLDDQEILRLCSNSGSDGFVNLVLRDESQVRGVLS